jgi:hypothetical protein
MTIFVFICKSRLVQTSQIGGQQYSDTSPAHIIFLASFASQGALSEDLTVCLKKFKSNNDFGKLII